MRPSEAPAGLATCAALTAAAASAVVGTSVTASAPDTSDGDGQSNCTYTAASGQTFRVYLTVGSDAAAKFNAMRSGVTDPTDVTGTGDLAFTSGQGVGALKGDDFASVIGQVPGDDDSSSVSLKVAQAMLDALGS
ncbi:MAG: hypothetical protein ACRDGQ_09140 [Candidatus Limnocylindrales bacterium]